MSRQYVAAFQQQGAGTTTIQTMLDGKAAATAGFIVRRGRFNQSPSTTSLMQRLEVVNMTSGTTDVLSTSGAIMSSVIPPLRTDDPVSKYVMGSSRMVAGTFNGPCTSEGDAAKSVLWEDSFHIFNGWEYIATPFDMLTANAGSSRAIAVVFTVGSTIAAWDGSLIFEEA